MMVTIRSLLFSVIAVPGSFAYIVSPSAPGTASTPTFFPSRIQPENQIASRATYDLGLGKNPPVLRNNKSVEKPKDTYDAAKFWMIPKPVSNYPSPLDKPSEPRKSTSRSIVPTRLAKDAVDISVDVDGAIAMLRMNPVDLDLNTLWVEMFIHHQQHEEVIV
jgi:hypothetical protein